MILLIAAGLWSGVLALSISLCKAAHAGDEAMIAAYRHSRRATRPRAHLRLVPDRPDRIADGSRQRPTTRPVGARRTQ